MNRSAMLLVGLLLLAACSSDSGGSKPVPPAGAIDRADKSKIPPGATIVEVHEGPDAWVVRKWRQETDTRPAGETREEYAK